MLDMERSSSITARFSSRLCAFCRTNWRSRRNGEICLGACRILGRMDLVATDGPAQRGWPAGQINPEIDPHSVANLLISMLEGARVVGRINKRSAALADAHRHLSLYLETAVRVRTDTRDGNVAV